MALFGEGGGLSLCWRWWLMVVVVGGGAVQTQPSALIASSCQAPGLHCAPHMALCGSAVQFTALFKTTLWVRPKGECNSKIYIYIYVCVCARVLVGRFSWALRPFHELHITVSVTPLQGEYFSCLALECFILKCQVFLLCFSSSSPTVGPDDLLKSFYPLITAR